MKALAPRYAAFALALVVFAIWSLTRVPTGFLPTEDQGYMIVVTQLPDGASKERTDAVLDKIQKLVSPIPGVEHVVTISGISLLDNRASLANAGATFVVMKEWDARLKEKDQDQESIQRKINGAMQSIPARRCGRCSGCAGRNAAACHARASVSGSESSPRDSRGRRRQRRPGGTRASPAGVRPNRLRRH